MLATGGVIVAGRTPGTVAAGLPAMGPNVAGEDFDNRGFDGVVCASNAFGGVLSNGGS